jgi:hypothetical protein
MSVTIIKETGSTILFRNDQNDSIVRWDFSNGNFEAIVGDDVDIDSVFKTLIQTDLIESVSEKNRSSCEHMLKFAIIRYNNAVQRVESQEKLVEELKTLFPDCTIEADFTARMSYSGFGGIFELIKVRSKNNRGWGLYASEMSSFAFISTTDSIYNPVIFTTTGYNITTICKKYLKAWKDPTVQDMIDRTIVYKGIGTERTQLLEAYKNILHDEMNRKLKEAESKSTDDILENIVYIKTGDGMSGFRKELLHYVCNNPPF